MSAEKEKEIAPQDRAALVSTLRDLRGLLQFQRGIGICAYPLTEGVRHFLNVTDTALPRNVSARSATSSVRPRQPPRPDEGFSASAVLAALRQEIEQCTLCPLASDRLGTVPGLGAAGSTLMVVGDWSLQEQGCDPATQFGPEEDAMLRKMMEAIGLQSEEVYVTNILKCCPVAGQDPGQECRESCFSYLVREIGAVRPRLICAMGDLAVRMLVGSTEPLFRLRGRFASYRYQSADGIPVMPTFHPRYLLANPEMKKATWKDLQAIRRRLDQLGK